MTASGPLRLVVLAATGQDVRKCSHCEFCSEALHPDQDISLEMLLQMVVMNDEEVLTTRTLWSDQVLECAPRVCTSNLNLEAILMALRHEARRRGLVGN
jgi:heterodisulfide reductase subunit C